MTTMTLSRLRSTLCKMQSHVFHVFRAAQRGSDNLARVERVTSDDLIYQIDVIAEEAIIAWLDTKWPAAAPIRLVMEGWAEPQRIFPRQAADKKAKYLLIIDPVDGTRVIMHDKRSAWSLAALAPIGAREPTLRDIEVAAMCELPTRTAARAIQISAIKGKGVKTCRVDRSSHAQVSVLAPSSATNLIGGFASFVKYFPENKETIVKWEVELFRQLESASDSSSFPLVFDDQYPCTGGQMFELLAGHDRFIADVRPEAEPDRNGTHALHCHPYDVCCALILQEAGCIVEKPDGTPLDFPLDTSTSVSWIGYANRKLADKIRPVLRRVLMSSPPKVLPSLEEINCSCKSRSSGVRRSDGIKAIRRAAIRRGHIKT